jgi:hypothetical protein
MDHVPFDRLQSREQYEQRLIQDVASDSGVPVAVIAPRGGGKSGLIAFACANLAPEYVALRIPIVAAGDPTDLREIAAITLTEALKAFDMEQHQAEALQDARADERTREHAPAGAAGRLGVKIGGGPIPAELNAELETLREQATTNVLAVDRLDGVDRLLSILVAGGRKPVFVLEDTEAAVGAGDLAQLDRFLDGPVRAYIDEVDAPLILAIQDDLAERSAVFPEMSASLRPIEIDRLVDPDRGMREIVARRLEIDDVAANLDQIFRDDAFPLMTAFYDETSRDFRRTLAMIQTAVESAMDMGADLVTASHVLEASNEWRSR